MLKTFHHYFTYSSKWGKWSVIPSASIYFYTSNNCQRFCKLKMEHLFCLNIQFRFRKKSRKSYARTNVSYFAFSFHFTSFVKFRLMHYRDFDILGSNYWINAIHSSSFRRYKNNRKSVKSKILLRDINFPISNIACFCLE